MSYRDLKVWQIAMELVTDVYKPTSSVPSEERFGLTAQIRRAAESVLSNIAEGQGRKAPRAFANHVLIAHGSLLDLETQLEIAQRLGMAPARAVAALRSRTAELGRVMNVLVASLDAEVAS
jgi:four helix bundle protein